MDTKKQKKLTKILIVGATCSKNNGSAAMVISTTKVIRQYIPNSTFTILSIFPSLDSINCAKYKLKVASFNSSISRLLFSFLKSIIWRMSHQDHIVDNGFLKEFFDSDIVVDLSGDSFSDDSTILDSILCCYRILLCLILNKPIVIYAQSIGPFKTIFTKFLSIYCLNRVDLLIARDEITVKYLKNIGIKNKIYFTADSAFLLDAAPFDELKGVLIEEKIDINKRPIIGISTSQHIYDLTLDKGEGSYILLMSKIVDYLIEKLDSQVILVPHVTNNERAIDDRFVGARIYEMAKNKSNIRLINNEYSPEILKGIIGLCDMFVGARMHANIASTSMGVPTLAIAYSHKAYGIMRMLDVEKYVLDFKTMNFDDMKVRIDDLWDHRVEISSKLRANVKTIKERSLSNAILVKDLFDSKINLTN